MICTYIYRYIYIKWHPKTAFLFATHAVILTLPHFTCFNVILYFYVFPFLFTLSFPFSFFIKRVFSKTKGLRLSLFFFSKALSKVLCVDSLRYLQERLALQHLLPAVPSRCTTMREDSGASYSRSLGYRVAGPPFGLATIAHQHASGTPRCMNSFDFVCIRARSAYRTVWCEPDTVSSWHPLPSDSSRLAIHNTRCSDIGRSKCSSR